MKQLLELLKKLFAGDKEKEKVIDDELSKINSEDDSKKSKEPEKKQENNSELEKLLSQLSQKDLSKSDNKELLAIISKLKEGQDKLLNEIAENKKKEEERNQILAEQAKKEKETKINELLELAKKDGRIAPKDDAKINSFKKLLENDFDSAKVALEALPKTNVKGNNNQTATGEPEKTKTNIKSIFGGNPIFLEKVKKDIAEK